MSLAQLRKKNLDHSLQEPQRLDFHLLLFYEQGPASHMVDFQLHDCRRGTLVHVSPGQVHAFGEADSGKATLLVFRPELLPTDFYGPDSRVWPPAEYVWPPTTQLKKDAMDFATATLGFLGKQHSAQGVWAQPEAARHIVIGLASLAYRTAASSAAMYRSQPHPLFFAFLSHLEQFYDTRRDARWYAAHLDCSHRTLSRICKGVSGETPKAIIDRRVATEARRLLAFTRESASTIGAGLGFADPTNFVKFFRRVVGETPDTFRQHWQR
ncbi:MAG: helix-turn-helix domain-containing protein [Fuerstiella sp.]